MVESTVAREVAFGLRNLGLEMDEVATRTDRALEVFGIEHLRTRPCHLLSAGEKQLVAVASIFTMEPAYVILDEATSLLDSVARRALLGAVGLLLERTGSGLVFITMRVEDVWMCEEIVHLEGGGIGFRGGKQAYLEYLSGRDLPLYGLALLVREIAKAMPDFARNVSECGRLDPDCIAGTLLRLGPAGGD
jgi:energy-coupling factor transporter ATP-binding protein EcfA2